MAKPETPEPEYVTVTFYGNGLETNGTEYSASKRFGIGVVRRQLLDRLHGDLGRHLAGCVPSHAVKHRNQRRLCQEGVLVMTTHQANVRARTPRQVVGGASGRLGAGPVVYGHFAAPGSVCYLAGLGRLCGLRLRLQQQFGQWLGQLGYQLSQLGF